MHKVQLAYTLAPERAADRALHHPLLAMLAAVHASGSISGAARRLELSYRHVWGELKRWEAELGQPLVLWVEGPAGAARTVRREAALVGAACTGEARAADRSPA